MAGISRRLREFLRCDSGVAAIEFALVVPFLLLLGLGGFGLSRLILIQQKAEKMAYSLADVASQLEPDNEDDIDQVFAAAEQVMLPLDFAADGVTIISAVYKETAESEPTVRWQCRSSGTLDNESAIGAKGEEASLPGDLELLERDGVIISEVFYTYEPIFSFEYTNFLESYVIYKSAVFRPRMGAIITDPCPS